MSLPLASLLNSLNKQSIETRITGACSVLNIILNLILIPKYSLIGAGITTVFTEFLSLLLHFIQVSKVGYNVINKYFFDNIVRIVISTVFMSIFIIYFYHLNLFVLIPLAALLYFTALYIMRGVFMEDINLIKIAISR